VVPDGEVLALSAALLAACMPSAVAVNTEDANAVARSLVEATETICVPYVVDEVPIEQLVRRPEVHERVDSVRGVDVIRYVVAGQGDPVVTPSPAKDFCVGPDGKRVQTFRSCWVRLDVSGDFARRVLQSFKESISLENYHPRPGHEYAGPCWPKSGVLCEPAAPTPPLIVCIRGTEGGSVTTSGPEYPATEGFPPIPEDLEVHVSGPEESSMNCN